MQLEIFKEIIAKMQEHDAIIDKTYDAGIDLTNLMDPIQNVVSHLIGSIYGEDGKYTFDWWCFDNEYGTRDLEMTDEEGNRLCRNIEDLYIYLEANKTDDYNLPIKLTDEERLKILKGFF
tara:strand:- start:995 stop:1354 length:360 start_codon:yes stop_codon:yes gene_type:complete